MKDAGYLAVIVLLLLVTYGVCREHGKVVDSKVRIEIDREKEKARDNELILAEEKYSKELKSEISQWVSKSVELKKENDRLKKTFPSAKPIFSAEIDTGYTKATGAPSVIVRDFDVRHRDGQFEYNCPEAEFGCVDRILGWVVENGSLLATGTQTKYWRYEGRDRKEVTIPLSPKNTKITAIPFASVCSDFRNHLSASYSPFKDLIEVSYLRISRSGRFSYGIDAVEFCVEESCHPTLSARLGVQF